MKPYFLFLFFVFSSYFVLGQTNNMESDNGYNIYYFPTGQISSEGFMLNGQPDGLWRSYYVNGILKSEGVRKHGMLDSIWVFYNEDGLLKEKINYLEGKKNGYYNLYNFYKDKDSNIVSYIEKEELYLNNKKNGKSIIYYKNGLLKSVYYYKNGLKDGYAKEFDENGNIIAVIQYSDGREIDRDVINRKIDSLKVGVWKEFYPNGKLFRESNYSFGKLNGVFREYSITGELNLSYRYENGVLVDTIVDIDEEINLVEVFYNKRDSSGELIKKESGGFKDGIPIGIHRTYDSLGRVNSSRLYDSYGNLIGQGIVDIEGDKIGEWKYFYIDGSVKSMGQYKSNRRVGLWKYFYENGVIEQKGIFTSGIPDNLWEWYYENGNLKRTENYKLGKENGGIVEYDELGKIILKGLYINGLKEGDWFYNYGFHTEQGIFKSDLRSGNWIYYYKNGHIYFEGEYIDGLENGIHSYYYKNGQLKQKCIYLFGRKDKNWEYYDYYGNLIKILTFDNNKLIKIDGVEIENDKD